MYTSSNPYYSERVPTGNMLPPMYLHSPPPYSVNDYHPQHMHQSYQPHSPRYHSYYSQEMAPEYSSMNHQKYSEEMIPYSSGRSSIVGSTSASYVEMGIVKSVRSSSANTSTKGSTAKSTSSKQRTGKLRCNRDLPIDPIERKKALDKLERNRESQERYRAQLKETKDKAKRLETVEKKVREIEHIAANMSAQLTWLHNSDLGKELRERYSKIITPGFNTAQLMRDGENLTKNLQETLSLIKGETGESLN